MTSGLGHHMGPNLLNTGYRTHGVVGIRSGVKRALEGGAVNALARPPRQSISKSGPQLPPAPLVGARGGVGLSRCTNKGSASCPQQTEYRRYADEALRWATKVATQKKKTQFLDIARVWTEAAIEVESSPLPNDSMKAL